MEKQFEANNVVRESITIALIQLMEQKELSEITITEIVRRAGVGRSSFYRNFSSKEDVLVARLDYLGAQWIAAHPVQDLRGSVLSMFRYMLSIEREIRLLYASGLSHLLLRHIRGVCGARPGQPNSEAYMRASLAGGIFGWCDEWVRRGMPESPEEMASLAADILDRIAREVENSRLG